MLDLAKHIVNQKTTHFESEKFEDCTFCYVTMTPARPRSPPSARPAAAITLIERRISLPSLSQRLLRKPATRVHRLFPKLRLTAARQAILIRKGLEPPFDFAKLKKIHRQVFQDVYEWAGKPRNCDLRKAALLNANESPKQFTPTG
jgi:hypothetical protein